MPMMEVGDKTADLGNGTDEGADVLGDNKQDDLGGDNNGSGVDAMGEIADVGWTEEDDEDATAPGEPELAETAPDGSPLVDPLTDEGGNGDDDGTVSIKGVAITFNTYQKTDYECGEVSEYTDQEYEFMKVAMILAFDPSLISMMDAGNYDAISHIEYFGTFDYKEQNYSDGTFSEPQTMSESILSEGTYIIGTFTENFDVYSWYTDAVVYAIAFIDIEALNAEYGTSYDTSKVIFLGASEVIVSGGEAETDADGWAGYEYQWGETDDPSEEALQQAIEDDIERMAGFEQALTGLDQASPDGSGAGAGSGTGQEGIVY